MEILFVLLILFTFITVVGHLIWVAIAAIVRMLIADDVVIADEPPQRSDPRHQQLKDLAVTEHQIVRFYTDGKLGEETFRQVMEKIRAERANISRSPGSTLC